MTILERKIKIFERKEALGHKYYNNRCFICHNQTSWSRGFTFHHLVYNPAEKIWSDFKNPLDYQEYILSIVENNPKQFLFLCKKCHYALEHLKRYGRLKLQRLLKAVRMSSH